MSNWWTKARVYVTDSVTEERTIIAERSGGGDSDGAEMVAWCQEVAAADPRRCFWEVEYPSGGASGQEAPHAPEPPPPYIPPPPPPAPPVHDMIPIRPPRTGIRR